MSLGKAISGALRQNIVNIFTVTSEDRDYGSAVTHNVIDDDIYNLFKKYPEIIHRYDYICGFDSPGYTLNSYVLTIVINNEIYNFPLNYEMY